MENPRKRKSPNEHALQETEKDVMTKWNLLKPKLCGILQVFDPEAQRSSSCPLSGITAEAWTDMYFEFKEIENRVGCCDNCVPALYIGVSVLLKDHLLGAATTLDTDPVDNQVAALVIRRERNVGISEKLRHLGGETLVKGYVAQYEGYCKACQTLISLVRYLNIVVTAPKKWRARVSFGELGRHSLQDLCQHAWKTYVYEGLSDRLKQVVHSTILRIRQDELVDHGIVSGMIRTWIGMGQNMYEQEYESDFIDSTRRFYLEQSCHVLQQDSIYDFLANSTRRIQEEESRVQVLFVTESLGRLRGALTESIISQHVPVLLSHLGQLLSCEDRRESLKQMHGLLRRHPGGPEEVSEQFRQYILQVRGGPFVTEHLSLDAKTAIQNCLGFVERLTSLYRDMRQMVSFCFHGDPCCQKALDLAMGRLMNHPAGTKGAAMPRMLAMSVHLILSRGRKSVGGQQISPEETEADLETIVHLTGYLTDFDEFIEHHRKHFMKRLLSPEKRLSQDLEEFFLSNLKAHKGEIFTRKLTSMLHDVFGEKTIHVQQDFHQWREECLQNPVSSSSSSQGIKFEPLVLNDCSWPLGCQDRYPLPGQPNEMLGATTEFESYYGEREKAKRLRWIYTHGRVSVQINLPWPWAKGSTSFVAIVSPMQAAILSVFNRRPELTLGELLGELWPNSGSSCYATVPSSSLSTPISGSSTTQATIDLKQHLLGALEPLCNCEGRTPFKLVARKGEEQKPGKGSSVHEDTDLLVRVTSIHIGTGGGGGGGAKAKGGVGASHGKREIIFPFYSLRNVISTGNAVDQSVQKERQYLIDCVIVKIMKTKRSLQWELLYPQVVDQLKGRFVPEKTLVKSRMEHLIDREYIERDQNDKGLLRYLA